MDETSRNEAILFIASHRPAETPGLSVEVLAMLSDAELAVGYELARACVEDQARSVEANAILVEAEAKAAASCERWIASIIVLHRTMTASLGKYLPRGARASAFEPTCEDAFSRFVEDTVPPHGFEAIKAADRRLRREIAWAFASTWRAILADGLARWARWVAVAVMGDGAVRAIYWTFSEIIRKL